MFASVTVTINVPEGRRDISSEVKFPPFQLNEYPGVPPLIVKLIAPVLSPKQSTLVMVFAMAIG